MTELRIRIRLTEIAAAAIDESGAVLGEASSPFETRSPEAGWLEQRPEEWWQACRSALSALRGNTSLDGVTNILLESDLNASVFLDGERDVIRPAILDGDNRGPHPLRWLRQHQAIAYKRVQHLLQPADYLRLMLTGEIATTPDDADRSGLFDLAAGAWGIRLCDELEINVELLPPIRRHAVAVLDDMAAILGIPSAVVVV